MKSSEVRKKFIDFFKSQNHHTVKSSSLIPSNDPTLLFTNAGMVQFKNIFLGQESRDYLTATSCQKCLRAGGKHNDLENVGRTSRHHTFFEMLGNFSFGSYFKEEAITFAWEFLTNELGIDKKKLYITIHKDDSEAEKIWMNVVGISKEKIYKLDDKDNFWSMGDTGPCGPCSEIMYDIGEEFIDCNNPSDCSVECECGRYLEIWNLVFMQFNRTEAGELLPLPSPSIDTGMGLERLVSVLQGVRSNYDTDLFTYLIDYVSSKLNLEYGKDSESDMSIRVLSDHARAVAFLICDGVMPSSDGRGYVVRRILRRAVRHYKKLGINEPFLHNLVQLVINEMEEFYPELKSQASNIISIITNEEEKFLSTIDRGFDQLEQAMTASIDTKVLSGKDIFKLYDTFGFPVDLIEDLVRDTDYTLDLKAYEEEMLNQKNSSKKASKFKSSTAESIDLNKILGANASTVFYGYDSLEVESRIIAIIKDNEIVSNLKKGDKVGIILEETPFYAESGGQVGDKGILKNSSCLVDIVDTQKTKEGLYVHSGIVKDGLANNGDKVISLVDKNYRQLNAEHHTGTHILHSVLRDILGTHVRQAGSLVKNDRLRFDFSHFSNIDSSLLKDIEYLCNERIRSNKDVVIDNNVDYKKAIKSGATAFFEEKYGDLVRVVRIGDFSIELCGGIHVSNVGELGLLNISSETSISSGIRRIEAHVGRKALSNINKLKQTLVDSSLLLNSSIDKVTLGIERLQKENDQLKTKLNNYEKKESKSLASEVLSNCETFNGIKIVSYLADEVSSNQLKSLWDDLKTNKKIVSLLGSNNKASSIMICACSSDIKGFDCREAINQISSSLNGKGGGKPNLAQVGCDRIDNLEHGVEFIKSQL